MMGWGGRRCLREGGSYFNFICVGVGVTISGSLSERGS